jgi:exodeoxyribonuclease VII large subunit
MHRNIFSITQVNRYVAQLLQADALTAGLFVTGEISNFNAHSSGHLYFTLKDDAAAISSVMFKTSAAHLKFAPATGMKIIAFGRLGLYEKTGSYQLYAEHMEQAGAGDAQAALDALKQKLSAEGLFEAARKRAIPPYAMHIGIITSPTGAAVQDMLRIIREKNPAIRITLRPTTVQGETAAADLVQALGEMANTTAEVIIIGRGGGSSEDLGAFNSEALARAIAACPIPIISAIGHETDYTIADMAADLRAPTPTAAAHTAAFSAADTAEHICQMQNEMHALLLSRIHQMRLSLAEAKNTMRQSTRDKLSQTRSTLAHTMQLLDTLSPHTAWRRGFALVRAQGSIITSAAQARTQKELTLQWQDGEIKLYPKH